MKRLRAGLIRDAHRSLPGLHGGLARVGCALPGEHLRPDAHLRPTNGARPRHLPDRRSAPADREARAGVRA
jgi:hypothetical protein